MRHVLREILRLPVTVVVTVLHPLVPDTNFPMKVFLIRVRERPHTEEEVVAIGRAVDECRTVLRRGNGGLKTEARDEVESMRKPECAIVMHVVAEPIVTHRRLRGCRFQRRMRINDCLGRVVSGIGNAPHSDPAIVVRNVFDEPVDRVVGVRALIDVCRSRLLGLEWSHPFEIALRHESSTHILINKDVAFVDK